MSADSGTAGRARPTAEHRRSGLARWTRRLPQALCAAAALGAGALSVAGPPGPVPPTQTRAEPELSRDQAMALVQKRYGARVVRTDIADQDGRRLYIFRLLSSGSKVWIVRVDARSGAEVP
jgi:hypothetical protein